MSSVYLSDLEPALTGTIAENAALVDREGRFPAHTIQALREAGLLGLLTPTAHGGRGATIADAARVVERIAQVCGSSAMVTCMHYSGAAVLAQHASADINAAVARGEHLSTLAFSEAGSRSHFWAPVSTARADGDDEVVLDARKSWVTSAHHATAYVWSSGPLSAEGASTLWLVPADAAGLSSPGTYQGLGLRGNDSTPVAAEGARIAAASRLGDDGAGFGLMMGTVLPAFSLMNSACSVGLMEGALAAAAAHLTATRYAHLGASLADLPTVRAYLAKARTRADMARALWERALQEVEAGNPDLMFRILEVKAATNDAAIEVTQLCMRVCGGAAYRAEVGVERRFRDAQAGSIMAPTADVLYDFMGKALCQMDLF